MSDANTSPVKKSLRSKRLMRSSGVPSPSSDQQPDKFEPTADARDSPTSTDNGAIDASKAPSDHNASDSQTPATSGVDEAAKGEGKKKKNKRLMKKSHQRTASTVGHMLPVSSATVVEGNGLSEESKNKEDKESEESKAEASKAEASKAEASKTEASKTEDAKDSKDKDGKDKDNEGNEDKCNEDKCNEDKCEPVAAAEPRSSAVDGPDDIPLLSSDEDIATSAVRTSPKAMPGHEPPLAKPPAELEASPVPPAVAALRASKSPSLAGAMSSDDEFVEASDTLRALSPPPDPSPDAPEDTERLSPIGSRSNRSSARSDRSEGSGDSPSSMGLRLNRQSIPIAPAQPTTSTLGRSSSVRVGGSTGRRRPSLSSGSMRGKNRRSILLTSFTPPLAGASTRTSSDSQQPSPDAAVSQSSDSIVEISIGGKTFQRSSMIETGVRPSERLAQPPQSAITLRPSSDAEKRTSLSLQGIGAKLGSVVGVRQSPQPSGDLPSPPAWMKEIQKRKKSAKAAAAEPVQPAVAEPIQPAEAEPTQPVVAEPVQPAVAEPVQPAARDGSAYPSPPPTRQDMFSEKPQPPASTTVVYQAQSEPQTVSPVNSANSIYRTLSATAAANPPSSMQAPSAVSAELPSLGDRQRAASQSNGIFAAVTSFFGRSSNSPSLRTTSNSPNSSNIAEFFGMRTSSASAANSVDLDEPAKPEGSVEMLLSQLDAQNQQILSDRKARVFAEREPDSEAKDDDDVDWDFWGNLINDYERVSKHESRKLAKCVHMGIPQAIRGTVWQLMSRSRDYPELLTAYRRLIHMDAPDHDKQIHHDLPRTFPQVEYFRDADGLGQEALYNVLKAYALYDGEVGYCQGLSFVAGPLLLNMPDEEAFCVLVRLMYAYGLRGHFMPDMDDLQLRLYQFDALFAEDLPLLSRHFTAVGVKSSMYASQWLMTLFAYRLPTHLTFRLYDLVFAEGIDSLLRVAIAVLRRSQTRLLSLKFEPLMKYLNDGPLFAFYIHASPELLVADANKVTCVSQKALLKLRKKFVDNEERKTRETEELAQLQAENGELIDENAALLDKLQRVSTAHSELTGELTRAHSEAQQSREDVERLRRVIAELEARVVGERERAEAAVKADMDRVVQKNLQLTMNNQRLEEHVQDMEAALVQTKMLFAESENEREEVAKKLDDMRKKYEPRS